MVIVIDPAGTVTTLNTERLDLAALGAVSIERASHVEPDSEGRWYAQVIDGPTLGPFSRRRDALAAEVAWLTEHRLHASASPTPFSFPAPRQSKADRGRGDAVRLFGRGLSLPKRIRS